MSPRSPLGTADMAALVTSLQEMTPAIDDADRIERLRQFETFKSAIAAAQLAEAAAFDTSKRAEAARAGVSNGRQGRGIAAQVALALHVSPWHATRWLGWAKILTRELPATFAELAAGRTNERRVLLVANETVWVSREQRAEIDALMAPRLAQLGDRRVEAEARQHACRLDPAGAADRRRVALGERRVSVRPRPDVMGSLTVTTSIEQAVAAWATLNRDADLLIGTGDPGGRSRDQIMADTLIARVTGTGPATGVPVEVELLIPSDTLFGPDSDCESDVDHDGADVNLLDSVAGNEPALLTVAGLTPTPIPAPLARDLIADAAQAWIRRLFTHPRSGTLVASESKARLFTAAQRRFLRHRDQYCSTPYCGAPIAHVDHAEPHERGGPTSLANGNGMCAACNHAKQAPGWHQSAVGEITTPTGHRYRADRPRPPGAPPPDLSPLVDQFWRVFDRAA